MNISFIGYGNIAKAIAAGLCRNTVNQLRAAAPSLPTGINNDGIKTFSDNQAVIANADVLILAVKPAQMSAVLTAINTDQLPAHCLVISVASGLNLSWFEHYLPNTAIVRTMPNIASAVGKGATPMIANNIVTKSQQKQAEEIFTSLGIATWIQNERDINAFTALSGSGPAYIFIFMEAMIKAAIKLGIAEEVAKAFTLQTFDGALELANQSKHSLSELRASVTSPAGTTAAAVRVLTQHNIDTLIAEAMHAAHERAEQLGTENNTLG